MSQKYTRVILAQDFVSAKMFMFDHGEASIRGFLAASTIE